MKKMISLVVLAILVSSVSACTGVRKESQARVKCPACGYEFEVPQRDQSKPN